MTAHKIYHIVRAQNVLLWPVRSREGALSINWLKVVVFGGRWGRGGAILNPTNSFLLLGVITSVSVLVKIDQEMRP